MVLYRHAASRSVSSQRVPISLFFDIAQGAGLAGAAGVRPFLPPLAAGALARADAGVDFEGSSYEFLESPAFLAGVLALAVLFYALERARAGTRGRKAADGRVPAEGRTAAPAPGSGDRPRDALVPAIAVLALALGALLFAGSLAAGDSEPWPGLVAGAACAALGFAAVAGFLERARARVDPGAAALLPVWADIGSLFLAAVAIAFPPLSLVALVALAYLLIVGRRAGDRKYRGLRILR